MARSVVRRRSAWAIRPGCGIGRDVALLCFTAPVGTMAGEKAAQPGIFSVAGNPALAVAGDPVDMDVAKRKTLQKKGNALSVISHAARQPVYTHMHLSRRRARGSSSSSQTIVNELFFPAKHVCGHVGGGVGHAV